MSFNIIKGDCLEVLDTIEENSIDMIFADPPYNLSNNGITCHAGKMVSVNKGEWDKSLGFEEDTAFHEAWISKCRRVLKDEGTIWISGTNHSIYKCGYILEKLGFYILNDIVWYKPNAAPNLSCKVFTHSHETILWAKKNKNAKHYYNYDLMKNMDFEDDKLKSKGKQMRSVWSISAPSKSEKIHGKHPTQKPLKLLTRIILASTKENDTILDPFNGSGTTAAACKIIGNRNYIGIEIDENYIELTNKRLNDIDNKEVFL
ncbi:site-specific DNA-methyltransferase [Brachyspira murdochii]|uniref:DNA-methyltransferase n=1 Tax=Brachyspira murdochii TaxID=84378 RepID=UPI003006FEFB